MKHLIALVLHVVGLTLVSRSASGFESKKCLPFKAHMYGIIGSAVAVGALSVWLIRRFKVKSLEGSVIELKNKAPRYKSAYLGGTLFGLGWAMTGACPGPMYALVGSGTTVMLLAIVSGVVGVWAYAALRDKLPH